MRVVRIVLLERAELVVLERGRRGQGGRDGWGWRGGESGADALEGFRDGAWESGGHGLLVDQQVNDDVLGQTVAFRERLERGELERLQVVVHLVCLPGGCG